MARNSWKAVTAGALATVLAIGCSQEAAPYNGAMKVDEAKPVTLTLFAAQNLSEELWKQLLHDPLKKQYPHITLNIIKPEPGKNIKELVVSGIVPDLVTVWNGEAGVYHELDLLEDMTPLLKKHNISVDRFERSAIEAIQSSTNHGGLVGLPYFVQANALLYNKDIFDKFGVQYPRDGMTWEETIELGKKLTQVADGVQYYGLNHESVLRISFPKSLSIVNAKTNKAEVNNEQWKQVFELSQSIYSIPGNLHPDRKYLINGWLNEDRFTKERNLAMYATYNILDKLKVPTESGLNWDMVQYPSYKDAPNRSGMVDIHMISVTKASKHKEDAVKVVEILTSDETQLIASKSRPAVTPLTNPEMAKQFGQDMPYLKGKNIQAMFKSKPAPAPQLSLYYNQARTILQQHHANVIEGKKDVNTALREAEQEINKKLAELTGK
jgi:ABC-type glycerol-3-phosphate transport system substrate-binding protein